MRWLLSLIPLITFAQSKKITSTKSPLILSITSDTATGKFYQVLFSYDQLDRVIGITHKILTAKTISKKQTIQLEDQVIQIFEYVGNSNMPFLRKTGYSVYDSVNNSWHTDFLEEQYFLHKNGKRVGDSTLLLKENSKVTGKLDQTDTYISHEVDLRPPFNPNKYEPPNEYSNDFGLRAQSNIGDEISRHFTGYKFVETTYYNFSKFDLMTNPLKQLNIASVMTNEKICFPFRGGENKSKEENFSFFRGGQYGEKGLCWYFFNQNNPLTYTVNNGETAPHNGIVQFYYTYNQFKQPIFATANVKIVMRGNEDYLIEKYQKRFTFKYKK